MQAAPLRYLRTPAADIPYYSWEVGDPRGVLIFLHGLKSHAGWFLRTGGDLAELSVKAYVFDRRG